MRDLVAQAVHGNGEARSIVRESGRRVGEALAATVTVLNPRAVVVGGDMAGAFDTFSAGLRDTLFPATTALAGRDLQVLAGDARRARRTRRLCLPCARLGAVPAGSERRPGEATRLTAAHRVGRPPP